MPDIQDTNPEQPARVTPAIDSLLTEVEKGARARAALEHLDPYVWPKIGRLLTQLCGSDDKYETLLSFKYAIKELIQIRQDFKREDDFGSIASSNLKKYYSKKQAAAGGQ